MAQRYALVIGISNYHRSLGNLTKPATDAQAVARCLQEYGGFQVTLLTEMLALETLRQTLKQFLLEQANGNDALIYFTGHGILLESTTGYRETFLAASDTEIVRQAGKPMEPLYILPFGELNSLIQQSSLSSLVLLLDCCHSGDMLERDPVERALTAFNATQRNYCFITACRSFEESRAKRSDDHSLFTGALLQALAPPTRPEDDRSITSGLLFYRLSQSLKGSGQEALHLGWGNDIAIATYPALPKDNSEPALNLANPYIGLASFDASTADYFYGREAAIRALQSRLLNCRVLTVFGPSGCGKSSLVKAGLLPELRDRPFESATWQVELLTPTAQPLENLSDRLKQRSQSTAPFILFIDQFEELFTLCDSEADQRSFIQLMTTAIGTLNHLKRIVIAIRGDFLDRCAKIPESATLINRETELTTYMVTHLSAHEMVAAIETPATQQGARFEMGLVPQIIADVGNEPGALPLLQYALTQLWDLCIQPDSPPILTFQGYEQIGGVQGALKQRADQLYRSLHPDDQGFSRQLLMELVQLGDGQEVTRRKAHWEKLRAIAPAAQLDRVVARLTQERLIVTDEKTVEVAHEALLSEWTLLKTWIEENRDNIRLSRRLEADCHDWQEKTQSEDYLLSAGRLAAIQEWVEKEQPKLTPLEQEFLNKSVKKRDRETQSQLDQERRLREEAEGRAIAEIEKKMEAEARALAETERAKESGARAKAERQKTRTAIGAGALVAVLITSLGFLKVQSTKRQEQIARAGEIKSLVGLSETYYSTHTQLEALIASVRTLWKLRSFDGNDNETLERINRVVSGIHEKNRFEDHSAAIFAVSFSPKGSFIASAGDDKLIRIWKPDGTLIKTVSPMRHEKTIWTVNFSSSGEFIVSGDQNGIIKISRKDGTLLDVFKGHTSDVNFVSFSPDEKSIISASDDKTVKVWTFDLSSKRVLKKSPLILQHNSTVWMATSSPNGHLIASAIDKRAINIWRADGTFLATLIGHTASVRYASFSSDGKALVSASDDNTIRIWQWQRDPKYWIGKILTDKSNKAYTVRFSPDNQTIAATSANGTIQLWRSKDLSQLIPFGRHLDQILDLAFSPDSKQIVTVSRDKTVRLWNLESVNSESQISIDHLLVKSCSWLSDYLRTNSAVKRNYSDVITICNTQK